MDSKPTDPETSSKPDASSDHEPLTPPRPRKSLRKVVLPMSIGVTAVGATTLYIMSASVNTCRGATRSARLQWEQRRQAVDQAIAGQSPVDASTGNSNG